MGEMKLDFKRMQRMQPIVTGTPQAVHSQSTRNTAVQESEGPSFSELLSQKLGAKGLTISKQAAVITTVGGSDLKGNVFTNISGTVII